MEFIIIVVLIILTLKLSRLSKRVGSLEERIRNTDISAVRSTAAQDSAPLRSSLEGSVQSEGIAQEVPAIESFRRPVAETKSLPTVFGWIKDNWLLKLGVLLILVGFGWFISYAFIHDWIGPFGRVALGLIVGSVLTLYGTLRMEKSMTQGRLFLILGSAIVIITTFAAQSVYGFFPSVVALSLVFLVSVYLATVALLHKMKNIAVYGLVVAFLAPILTHATVDIKILFSYLMVVSLASLWLATIKGWREINAVSLFGFSLFALSYVADAGVVNSPEQFFVFAVIFILGFVYFLVSVLGVIKNREDAGQSDVFVAILDSMLIIITTITLVPEEIRSLVLAAWMIVFAVGSFLVFSYTKKEKFFYVYSLISVLLLIIATAAELEGSALIYAFAIESAIISIAGYLITRRVDVGYNLSLLMIWPAIMSLPSLSSSSWSSGIFHDDFGILFTVGALLFFLGLFYFYFEQEMERYGDTPTRHSYAVLCVVGSIYFLALVWLVSGAVITNEGAAVLVSLVVYTILGITTYFYGLVKSADVFRRYGATLLIFVILRLIFVDVWDMELAERIITFISIGILFISTAFIGKKVKDDLPEKITTN